MTTDELIDETVAYICQHGQARGDVGNGCAYWNKDGKMCAVGRCLLDPKKIEEESGNFNAMDDIWDSTEELDGSLKPEYRGFAWGLWAKLQQLHDDCGHWLKNDDNKTFRLSEEGQIFVNELKHDWSVLA